MKMLQSFKHQLEVSFDFIASHSLHVREEPHDHLWEIHLVLEGTPKGGFLFNLIDLRNLYEEDLKSFEGTFLNQQPLLDLSTRQTPTCETLSLFFFQRWEKLLQQEYGTTYPDVYIYSIGVTLFEKDGKKWGTSRVIRNPK